MSSTAMARKATPSLFFNGANVDTILAEYLESVAYTDVASGSSDTLSITLHNIDGNWLTKWYPAKGDAVSGSLKLWNWENDGIDKTLQFGDFTLDDIKFSFSPKTAQFSCVSAPAAESFKVRERDKTWESITIQGIATEICGRYDLELAYSAGSILIQKLEQSENDSSFLSKLCEDYGLAMKIYKSRIVIYDQNAMEAQEAVATLSLQSFAGGDVTITDITALLNVLALAP